MLSDLPQTLNSLRTRRRIGRRISLGLNRSRILYSLENYFD
jgi:hypothetical protein